jgi:rubrerythrin
MKFNADEMFEMAEQIERNGAAFYKKAAESVEGNAEQLFLDLAAKEEDHEKTFAAMRGELTEAERFSSTRDPDNEAAMFLQHAVDGEVFDADPAGDLSGQETVEQILRYALGREKDTIVFFQSMKEMVPKQSGKEKLDGIIAQEVGHIVDIITQLKELK